MPVDEQEQWKSLRKELGERKAYAELARKLRVFSDHLDKLAENPGMYPDVYGCDIQSGDMLEHSFIERVAVTLSDPWPG